MKENISSNFTRPPGLLVDWLQVVVAEVGFIKGGGRGFSVQSQLPPGHVVSCLVMSSTTSSHIFSHDINHYSQWFEVVFALYQPL